MVSRVIRRWVGGGLVLAGLGLAAGASGRADDPTAAPVLPAAEAREHVGERRTVELTVRSSVDEGKARMHLLDSEADYKDPKNLAVVIGYDDLGSFRKAGIADPAAHYKDRRIRVTGRIYHDAEVQQTRLRVTDIGQIAVVEPKAP